MKCASVVLVISILYCCVMVLIAYSSATVPEDALLNFTELASKYGQKTEEYDVETVDGYLLKLFHIAGNPNTPVFIVPGILDSADSFIIRGPTSLAARLAANDYDVWLATPRGASYSRRHITLNPNTDKVFWNFSMHEIALYDLPVLIDFILAKTGQETLNAIGHSQGTMSLFILTSVKPEYNNKLKCFIALAPVCYLHHVKDPLASLVRLSPYLNKILTLFGVEEVIDSITQKLLRFACSVIGSYELCGKRGFLNFAGYDEDEFEPEFLRTVIWHYPTSTSRKNLLHVSQIARSKRFAQFDYGEDNMKLYNSTIPPLYDLSKVTTNTYLFPGKNDKMATLEDVKILNEQLPNAIYHPVNRTKMNHLDFVWGKHMTEYLFPDIFSVLAKYNFVGEF